MILDTAFLHDLMYGDADAVEKAREIDKSGNVALSSMTVYELYYGIGYIKKKRVRKRRRWIQL